jgi:hypothetical protein
MNKKQIVVFLSVIFLLAATLIVLFPIFKPGLLVTDDGGWMVVRLSAFFQSLREGQFPVRFLGRLNQSYGYPVANFLYPGFMYIGSALHALGLSFQDSVEAIVLGSVITGVVFTFFWLRRLFSNIAGIAGACVYLLMPYLLYDIFRRGSVGEILVIGLMPVALFAIESRYKWLLAPAIALLAISHNTLAAFFIPILLGYIVLKKYWSQLLHFIIGVGMSSFFWLPALFERRYVAFDTTAISNPMSYFPISHTLILWSIPIGFAILYLLMNKGYQKQKEFWFFVAMVALSIFFASGWSTFFWRNSNVVKFVQFPFRWLSLLTVAGPWLVACGIHALKKGKLISIACIIFLFVGNWATQYVGSVSVVQPEGFFSTNEATTTVQDEYMPLWASKQMSARANKRIVFFMGRGTIDEKYVNTQKIDVVIHAKEESVIQINTVYYPGWGAILDGVRATILHENEFGLMRITVPAGDHQLYMEFRETPGRFLADALSAAFGVLYLISLIGLLIFPNQKKGNKRK